MPSQLLPEVSAYIKQGNTTGKTRQGAHIGSVRTGAKDVIQMQLLKWKTALVHTFSNPQVRDKRRIIP
ncbi:hypothetical protein SY88_03060 [Clostridiales bacterium PH28_bin88]|nr:hypothetical protein SY88_03060 [Clostridiales bacterium PH28_bin88]